MSYTSNVWSAGDVVTAAKLNNLETQWTGVRDSFVEKFSTASTGTKLLDLLSTPSTGTLITAQTLTHIALVYVPPYWQPSRVELSMNSHSVLGSSTAAAIGDTYLRVYDFYTTAAALPPLWGSLKSSHTNPTGWTTATTSITLYPGHTYALQVYVDVSTNYFIRNIRISGTSTTPGEHSSLSQLLFTTKISEFSSSFSTST